jgi:biopolymer transport protein ExbD
MAQKPSSRRRGLHGQTDIDLTPLMNVFIIVIPFLLLTAVFAKTAVIDIYLPAEAASDGGVTQEPATAPKLLIVKVMETGFVLDGIGKGVNVPKAGDKYDFARLTKELALIKDRHPSHQEVIILLGPQVKYDLVVQAMDATRETTVDKSGKLARRVLFPLVSLGEVK